MSLPYSERCTLFPFRLVGPVRFRVNDLIYGLRLKEFLFHFEPDPEPCLNRYHSDK